jgi:regulatory protein
LVRERYLDDQGFAARFARTGLRHRGLGRNRIRQGLRQRGVGRDQAEAGLAEALDDVSEAAALEALARRYWQTRQRDEPQRRLRNLWGFLVRRGYPADLVAARLRAWWPSWRDALDGLEPPEETETDQKDD